MMSSSYSCSFSLEHGLKIKEKQIEMDEKQCAKKTRSERWTAKMNNRLIPLKQLFITQNAITLSRLSEHAKRCEHDIKVHCSTSCFNATFFSFLFFSRWEYCLRNKNRVYLKHFVLSTKSNLWEETSHSDCIIEITAVAVVYLGHSTTIEE